MIDGAEEIKKHLAKIIYVQRTDTTYDSVDFDDPMSVIEYFAKLYHPLYLQDSEEEINQIIAGLMLQIFRKDTKDGSKKSGIQALLIMRSAAMKVHNAFQELDSNQVKDIADLVMLAMVEALESIKNLANDDDESSPI
jgi:hypothetical protein